MLAIQIAGNLSKLISRTRIVFWYDARGEFAEVIESLDIGGATVLRQDRMGALEIKVQLEIRDTEGKYLIYAPYPQPEDRENWLLDIELYSRTFHADAAAMYFNELGLASQSLMPHIRARLTFCNSQERFEKLKQLVVPEDDERSLDLKMLAVTARADRPDFFEILMRLYAAHLPEEEGLYGPDLEGDVKMWNEIRRFGLEERFWLLAREHFAYDRVDEQRTRQNLLFTLMLTDFNQHLTGEKLDSYRNFLLKDPRGATTASYFLNDWRQHVRAMRAYDAMAELVSRELRIGEKLGELNAAQLREVQTFALVDKRILSHLRDELLVLAEGGSPQLDIDGIIQRRLENHWLAGDSPEAGHLRMTYEALRRFKTWFDLRWQYTGGFIFTDADDAHRQYCASLFRFDQHHRRFCELADAVASAAGFDILKSLREKIETGYSDWYLHNLALAWMPLIEDRDGRWRQPIITATTRQQHFFRNYVQPIISESRERRVFVIISDAMRYEIAEELAQEILGKRRFEAGLETLLGVVPSYTALGMAALLPQRELRYEKDWLVDGSATSSLQKRSEILAAVRGVAVHAKEIINLQKEAGRGFIKDFQVVYIYHDTIDATGDHASSEENTFAAVRQALDELGTLIRTLVNNLNATTVFLTADHGFLFTARPLAETEKSALEFKPSGTVTAKKRYVIGENLGPCPVGIAGSCRDSAGATGGTEFWIPRGVNRFHFVGGARYVHGGAMPQEIFIPLLTVKQLKGKTADQAAARTVGVSLLTNISRITNSFQRFEFIQTEVLSDRVKKVMLEVFIEDAHSRRVSTEQRVEFDSQSDRMEDRTRVVTLSINAAEIDPKHEYRLVWRDAAKQVELGRVPVIIDLAFGKDF